MEYSWLPMHSRATQRYIYMIPFFATSFPHVVEHGEWDISLIGKRVLSTSCVLDAMLSAGKHWDKYAPEPALRPFVMLQGGEMEEETTLYERGYHGVVHSVLWVQRGGALIRDRLHRGGVMLDLQGWACLKENGRRNNLGRQKDGTRGCDWRLGLRMTDSLLPIWITLYRILNCGVLCLEMSILGRLVWNIERKRELIESK